MTPRTAAVDEVNDWIAARAVDEEDAAWMRTQCESMTAEARAAALDVYEQALDRMRVSWDQLHPGDLTEDERHQLAQSLWFGMEELERAIDALREGADAG